MMGPDNEHTRASQKEKSTIGELLHELIKNLGQLIEWLKPDPKHPLALQILLVILKFPVVVFVLVLSPIAFVVLLFVFIATL